MLPEKGTILDKLKPDLTKLSSYDYFLPEELIAQTPIKKRDASRLLVIDRSTGSTQDRHFSDITEYLRPGDCLVINDTKVIPARLFGTVPSSSRVEVLLLRRIEGEEWQCMTRPGKKTKPGTTVDFGEMKGVVTGVEEDGLRHIRFEYDGIFNEILGRIGLMPLPPYIKKTLSDNERYQTVYAKTEGSAAAPTAGLHFTPELLKSIENMGVTTARVLLHVGIGTFRPVKEENITEHQMHTEHICVTKETADAINAARRAGGRIICVGTTSCRTLESVTDESGIIHPYEGETGIYIYPPYKFKAVDALITNFHLPESSLLMLVCAFGSYDIMMNAYRHAVGEKYRFFSFGDAMFIQ